MGKKRIRRKNFNLTIRFSLIIFFSSFLTLDSPLLAGCSDLIKIIIDSQVKEGSEKLQKEMARASRRSEIQNEFKEMKFLTFLGSGENGDVYLVTYQGKPYSAKIYQKEKSYIFEVDNDNMDILEKVAFGTELSVAKRIKNDIARDHKMILMDYVEGVTIENFLKNPSIPFSDKQFVAAKFNYASAALYRKFSIALEKLRTLINSPSGYQRPLLDQDEVTLVEEVFELEKGKIVINYVDIDLPNYRASQFVPQMNTNRPIEINLHTENVLVTSDLNLIVIDPT